ncbi:hypothetical protein Pse7367_1130 [Thalassoporum mexicanum PCC 7367]|uniref:hypothetical protein n=1 Tax=Thalassoporum mexicanum TaxID=3457544 RepID=UPI00029F8D88|nr:hypothetical protein [Pseudanabaena sp. PCC 7367]AFY69427.1 hypothetical protein Pse7367_1130 [Pseudanabaena sp. PCC 7367]
MSKYPLVLIAASLIFAVLPLLSVLLANLIGNLLGCQVNEGFANSCQVGSFELGGILAWMFTAGWYIFFTLPIGLVGVGGGSIWLIMLNQK